MENLWLRRYSYLLAAATFFLIVAGAAVTSNQAGLSVPDWPLSYGKVMPEMKDGVFYEHGHRMVATTVGFLTVVLAVWMQFREPRAWMRKLGWAAVGLVIAQGVLGGLTVLFLLPKEISIAHACLAQLFFSTTVAIAVFQSSGWARGPEIVEDSHRPSQAAIAKLVPIVVIAQLLLGAAFRHNATGLLPHVTGALIVAAVMMLQGVSLMSAYPNHRALNRSAGFMMSILGIQLLLGLGAYAARASVSANTAPSGWLVFATVSHVACGALALAASIATSIQVFRHVRAKELVPAAAGSTSKQQATA